MLIAFIRLAAAKSSFSGAGAFASIGNKASAVYNSSEKISLFIISGRSRLTNFILRVL
jgi:hypothetical protein